jgi:hypothetical protein
MREVMAATVSAQKRKKYHRWLMMAVWLLVFFTSRWWVLEHPPYRITITDGKFSGSGFSDVKQDYERYANMWKYGLTPYFEQLYEYPPATIPFVYLPLEVDLAGFGYYYYNYRVQIFIVEAIFFGFLYLLIQRLPMTQLQKRLSLLFFILAGMWAKDYWYEGIDLVFALFLAGALMVDRLVRIQTLKSRIIFWTLFWLSTAIKYMTFPLALPFLLLSRIKLKNEITASMIGFLIVWGFPLAYFRSSLSVPVVFHMERPLKYGSFGTYILNVINDYTRTETQTDILPHYPIVGPVASFMEKTVSLTFLMAIMATTLILTYWAWLVRKQVKTPPYYRYQTYIRMSLIYMMVLFLTTKVFSSPFHIWYVPLMSILAYPNLAYQLTNFSLAGLMLGLDTTPYLKAPEGMAFGQTSLARVRDAFRFIPMLILLYISSKWSYLGKKNL